MLEPVTEFCLHCVCYRELAFQISEQFEALGASIGIKSGKGLDMLNI